jgi:hypothetical protein
MLPLFCQFFCVHSWVSLKFLLGLSFGSNDQLKKKGNGPISLGYPRGYQMEIPMETIFMKMDWFLYDLQSLSWGKTLANQLFSRGNIFKTS